MPQRPNVQLLHRLLQRGRGDSPPAQPTTPLTRSSKGYSLRVVGHSLGAGAAILLSLMLKRDFPGLRCLAYGTPGGLLSPGLAEATKAWTTTFIVGRDLVPRLSLDSVYALRDDLLRLLARCRANKNAVLRSVLDKNARAAVDRLLHPAGEEPRSEFLAQLEAYEEQMRAVERRVTQTPLVPAGRLVHFVKSHQAAVPAGPCGKGKRTQQFYTPVWASPEDFQRIYVSSSMALDHFPDRMLVVMRETCEHMGIEV
jgi:sn1-specific diacylglycerol lipase